MGKGFSRAHQPGPWQWARKALPILQRSVALVILSIKWSIKKEDGMKLRPPFAIFRLKLYPNAATCQIRGVNIGSSQLM
jgi:hypothetical protein